MNEEKKQKSSPADPTPVSGAETDVAPLTRRGPKPAHEQTADEDIDVADWDRVAAMEEFRTLLAAKVRFIVPATIFFVVYYFALPVLVGYVPGLMAKKIIGPVNLAYLFALSQFFVAWTIAALYLRASGRFDTLAKNIVTKLSHGRGKR